MISSTPGTTIIGAIDQGTSSTRFTVYSSTGEMLVSHQVPVKRSTPHPGWIEQDPLEIIGSVGTCMDKVTKKLQTIGRSASDVIAIGITNQRETLVVWEKGSGLPLYNAIVWCDNRNADVVNDLISKYGANYFQKKTGLTLSPYFTATKLLWLRQNVPAVQAALDNNTCQIGTIDTWITWCLTRGNTFVTDVTNASRTFLMDINRLEWDNELLQIFGIPKKCLPKIHSSAEIYGRVTEEYGPYEGVAISGMLGDQQASLVGTHCIQQGTAKITYGTGCFLLYNTGEKPIFSDKGLITTVGYKFGKKAPTFYALEGSVATCGAAVQWLGDIFGKGESVHELAASVKNSGGVYFVPAFSGLLCPHWKPDARGCFLGLTGYSSRGHIARAVLEGIAFQAMDVLNVTDSPLTEVRVDGGLSRSDLLIQFQADLLEIDVKRAANVEATSRGAAIAAAHGIGLHGAGIVHNEEGCTVFKPKMQQKERARRTKMWRKAIQRSMDWFEPEEEDYDAEGTERDENIDNLENSENETKET
ncbi:glycerol kinase family protein [Tritrichomonas foetus]|uniref:glycerol kinase n=1 Tax=Tritrichomonas foetus TaxID=1144522 RepID=A0A1J4KEF2_9EUKA|nr:glycerol kinase family protein [Tritrichomonas foetus]|eukprot:OHT09386.1 glycerol kinase family protein [Tritrichomonas foetus]